MQLPPAEFRTHDVRNFWIVYPLGAWLAILAARTVFAPAQAISESDIKSEIEQQSGPSR